MIRIGRVSAVSLMVSGLNETSFHQTVSQQFTYVLVTREFTRESTDNSRRKRDMQICSVPSPRIGDTLPIYETMAGIDEVSSA